MAKGVVSSTHLKALVSVKAHLYPSYAGTKGETMAIVTVGIDLAKSVFAVHGVDESGKPGLVRPEVARVKFQVR